MHVRRTDATPAFVALQAERGKHAERLDLLSDELGGPYDAVLAMCVLIHVERAQTDAVLQRIAAPRAAAVLLSRPRTRGRRRAGRRLPHDLLEPRRVRGAARSARACDVEWEQRHVDSADETWLTFLSPARL